MIKNRTLSILPALTAVAFVMAARGAFAGKVVALLRGLRRSADATRKSQPQLGDSPRGVLETRLPAASSALNVVAGQSLD